MSLVWKLLRQHISISQFAGFFFANLVGVLIILVGVQFYTDVQAVYDGEDSFMKEDYLIVNKQIGAVTTISGKSNAFTEAEIADIRSQSFVSQVGTFTSSAFNVSASFDLHEYAHFSTDMFFESVPDGFVDVKSSEWTFKEGDSVIPIILPRNYLDLYNFGYAQSRNMPKLSEGIFGAIKLDIEVSGNNRQDQFQGVIVGFSSRLNTILVPQSFMEWANNTYASGQQGKHTRLILQVNNPTDDRITSYLQDHDLQTDQDKLDASKTTYVLRVIVTIVMIVGLIISILAIYILMLSIYLLVEKNNAKLENLLLIGYSPARVAFPYQLLTLGLNFLVLFMAFGLLLLIRSHYLSLFQSFFPDFEVPALLPSLLVGILLLILVSIINIIIIRGKVQTIWNRKD